MPYQKDYYRKKAKENRETNKKLSELYRSLGTPGESFTQFKKKNKLK